MSYAHLTERERICIFYTRMIHLTGAEIGRRIVHDEYDTGEAAPSSPIS
jgi:hypothetical protein